MTRREKLFVNLMEEAIETLELILQEKDALKEASDLIAIGEMLELGGFGNRKIKERSELIEELIRLHKYTSKLLRFGEMEPDPYTGKFPYEEVVQAYENISDFYKGGDPKRKVAKKKKTESSLKLGI